MATSPRRRRERSVRATAASALLIAATTLVVAALVVGSLVFLSAAAVFTVISGWAVVGLYRTEVVSSRRETAAVRADLAIEYRDLLDQRTEEQAVFLSAMTDQLVFRERELVELDGVVTLAERRADVAEEQLRETRRQLSELQDRLPALFPEQAGSPVDDFDTVVDLLGWGRTSTADQLEQRRQA